jgi:uncharacterized protein (DUF2267 family)
LYFLSTPIGGKMNEIVGLIVKKLGISEDKAQAAVKIVVDYLKKKLPATIGTKIDAILKGSEIAKKGGEIAKKGGTAVKKAEGLIGGLTSKLGGKKK